jgi:hypothetical protein
MSKWSTCPKPTTGQRVRVWYAPLQALGGSHWPVQGFIYPAKPKPGEKLAKPAGAAKAAPSRDPIGDIIKRKMRW